MFVIRPSKFLECGQKVTDIMNLLRGDFLQGSAFQITTVSEAVNQIWLAKPLKRQSLQLSSLFPLRRTFRRRLTGWWRGQMSVIDE